MLKWYYYVLLGIVGIAALVMTWWSMYDLAVYTLSAPKPLAAVASTIFDLGAIYLSLLAIEYAKTPDSGFWVELATFSFIGASTYIVTQHGIIENYPEVGVFMFAAAPVILGILLKVTLNYLNRQQRRESGRITEKLPSVGLLTWIRYRKQTWHLMSVAMQGRLVNAADKLHIPEDRHAIFAGKASVHRQDVPVHVQLDSVHSQLDKDVHAPVQEHGQMGIVEAPRIDKELTADTTPELVHVQPITQEILPGRTEQDIDEIVYTGEVVSIPEWLPREPTIALGRIAEICIDNNVTDTLTILQWARDIKHSDVKYGSVYKAVQRAKEKAN